MSRRVAGYSVRAVALLLAPFPIGLGIATVAGWRGLASDGRMLVGWLLLLAASVLVPLFLKRAARAILGHESEGASRGFLWTGVAALAVALAAAVVTPWRELALWLASTLTDLTGFSVPLPAKTP